MSVTNYISLYNGCLLTDFVPDSLKNCIFHRDIELSSNEYVPVHDYFGCIRIFQAYSQKEVFKREYSLNLPQLWECSVIKTDEVSLVKLLNPVNGFYDPHKRSKFVRIQVAYLQRSIIPNREDSLGITDEHFLAWSNAYGEYCNSNFDRSKVGYVDRQLSTISNPSLREALLKAFTTIESECGPLPNLDLHLDHVVGDKDRSHAKFKSIAFEELILNND